MPTDSQATSNPPFAATDGSASCGFCGSKRIHRQNNARYDIWPGGEEDQHIETCLDCKAERFIVDWREYKDGKMESGTATGKWWKRELHTPNGELSGGVGRRSL